MLLMFFNYFVAIEVGCRDNQAQITKTIKTIRFRKGKLIITCVILANLSIRYFLSQKQSF